MYVQIKPNLLELYGPNQFGFRPKSSTLCALISLLDFITSRLDGNDVIGVALVSFDMSKAFDRLSHNHLLETLMKSSLPHKCLRWLANYLQDRMQRVTLPDGTSSSPVKVTSGVPQGAILSPYLFASHMGSLEPAGKHTEMVKFADDVAIAIPYQNSTDIEQLLTTELTNMKDWCNCNGLILNEKKTKVMLIDKRRNKDKGVMKSRP